MNAVSKKFNQTEVQLERADITKETTDAIVNAANSSLLGGGGVDGAIHRAGGPQILEECKQIRNRQGQCKPGDAVITSAGNMKPKHVVHTVGPIWQGGNAGEPETLNNAYRNSLNLAAENGCKSVAFPSISTGVYGYPVDKAADVALNTVAAFCREDTRISLIRFVLFDEKTFAAYKAVLERL